MRFCFIIIYYIIRKYFITIFTLKRHNKFYIRISFYFCKIFFKYYCSVFLLLCFFFYSFSYNFTFISKLIYDFYIIII